VAAPLEKGTSLISEALVTKTSFCLRRDYDKTFDEQLQIQSVLSVEDLNDVKIDAVFICTQRLCM